MGMKGQGKVEWNEIEEWNKAEREKSTVEFVGCVWVKKLKEFNLETKLRSGKIVVTLNNLLKTRLLLFIFEGRVPDTLKAPR